MPVRELGVDEEVVSTRTVRPLRPEEDIQTHPEVGPRPLGTGEEVFSAPRSDIEAYGRGANVRIADFFGGPVDIANFLLQQVGLGSDEPIAGSKQLRRMFSEIGWAPPPGHEDPESLAGSIGKMTGTTASSLLMLGLGPLSQATRVATGAAQPATSVAGGLVQQAAQTAISGPGRFLAGEIAAAAGAGAGGYVAEQIFPGSDVAKIVGELGGGLTPAAVTGVARIAPTAIGAQAVRRLIRAFGSEGVGRRAGQRMQEAAGRPEQAARGVETERFPEAGLTPAQLSGDEGLLSLEKAVIESSAKLQTQSDEQIANATAAIREGIASLGQGVPAEATAETLTEARNYLLSLVDTRMRIAARLADERIAALGPKATQRQANLIAREELENALSAARTQERELWEAVPQTEMASATNTLAKFEELRASLPKAQSDDMPDVATRLLGREKNDKGEIVVPKGAIQDTDTVRELQGLRSKLLETARQARAGENRNAARIADELADAVLVDLEASAAQPELRAALDFSRQLNERFTRGTVARVLGTERRGGGRVAEELTLETTVGRPGPAGRVEEEALFAAADTPAMRGAVEDYLRNTFARAAIRGTELNDQAARGFLMRNQDVLEDFPALRLEIEGAIKSKSAAEFAQKRAEGLASRLNDPKISRAAIFLKEPLENAMPRVFKSDAPDATMRELVRQAKRDPDGNAVKGLKSAFGEFLLSQASSGRVSAKGEYMISGTRLTNILSSGAGSKMAKELLTAEERARLDDIADAATKIDQAIRSRPSKEGIISDIPNTLQATLARIMGARVGRALDTGTIQAPGYLAGFFERARGAVRGGDPAVRLLTDAMQDKTLFATLLRRGDTVAERRTIRRQLEAWLAGVSAEEHNFELPTGFDFSRMDNGKPVIRHQETGEEFIQR